MDVIVLDGNQRSALAAVRSLGKKGVAVAAGEEAVPSLSSTSKFCKCAFQYPSAYTNPDGFVKAIQQISSRYRGAILFPMTDVTVSEVLRRRADLSKHVHIPNVDYNSYNTASHKINLLQLAQDLLIPIPRTLFSTNYRDLYDMVFEAKGMVFPLVLKPAKSRIRTEHGWTNAGVRYARNLTELKEMLDDDPFRSYPFLVQERIQGPGMGIFLLMHNGHVVARFAHQRVREKPPSGGVSVVCKSIPPPPQALDAATKLLEALTWTGVAMVEFKWDSLDNTPKLMEVNARFWGSLQLAISAGVDFPYLLYRLARGIEIERSFAYKAGLKSRWELGDLDHLLIRMKGNNSKLSLPLNAPSKGTILKEFLLDFFRYSVRHEVFRPDDPKPFLFEARQYLKDLFY